MVKPRIYLDGVAIPGTGEVINDSALVATVVELYNKGDYSSGGRKPIDIVVIDMQTFTLSVFCEPNSRKLLAQKEMSSTGGSLRTLTNKRKELHQIPIDIFAIQIGQFMFYATRECISSLYDDTKGNLSRDMIKSPQIVRAIDGSIRYQAQGFKKHLAKLEKESSTTAYEQFKARFEEDFPLALENFIQSVDRMYGMPDVTCDELGIALRGSIVKPRLTKLMPSEILKQFREDKFKFVDMNGNVSLLSDDIEEKFARSDVYVTSLSFVNLSFLHFFVLLSKKEPVIFIVAKELRLGQVATIDNIVFAPQFSAFYMTIPPYQYYKSIKMYWHLFLTNIISNTQRWSNEIADKAVSWWDTNLRKVRALSAEVFTKDVSDSDDMPLIDNLLTTDNMVVSATAGPSYPMIRIYSNFPPSAKVRNESENDNKITSLDYRHKSYWHIMVIVGRDVLNGQPLTLNKNIYILPVLMTPDKIAEIVLTNKIKDIEGMVKNSIDACIEGTASEASQLTGSTLPNAEDLYHVHVDGRPFSEYESVLADYKPDYDRLPEEYRVRFNN